MLACTVPSAGRDMCSSGDKFMYGCLAVSEDPWGSAGATCAHTNVKDSAWQVHPLQIGGGLSCRSVAAATLHSGTAPQPGSPTSLSVKVCCENSFLGEAKGVRDHTVPQHQAMRCRQA